MEQIWLAFHTNTMDYFIRIFLACSLLFILELVLRKSQYSFVSRIRGLIFWTIYIIITALSFTLFWKLWAILNFIPLIHINLSLLSKTDFPAVNLIAAVFIPILWLQFGEFFYYWFHRLQHSINFLWKFHAVHHSLREMSAWNSNHHFTEEIFRIPFVVIPTSLLFSVDQGHVPWIVATLMGAQGVYEHSCTKIHLGWFRYVVPDNRYHRIHHSIEDKHMNMNFGSGSAIWDIIFRTSHFPKKEEWPEVGLAEIDEPKTIFEFLWRPFSRITNKKFWFLLNSFFIAILIALVVLSTNIKFDSLEIKKIDKPGSFSFNSKELIFKSWSHPEASHRWSLGKSSDIAFIIEDKDIFSGKISLILGSLGKQRISVSLNTQHLVTTTVNGSNETVNLSFNKNLLKENEENILHFEFPDAKQPGIGDRRVLAVNIQEIIIGKNIGIIDRPGSFNFNSKKLIFKSWSQPEASHRWSLGEVSQINFDLQTTNKFTGKIIINGHSLGKQNVHISLNGHKLKSQLMDGQKQTIEINFAPSLFKVGRKNVLEFSLPDAKQPGNGDLRQLALALTNIHIE